MLMDEIKKQAIETEKKKEKVDWNFKPYLAIALLAFLVFCGCISVFFLMYRYQGVSAWWDNIKQILQPILIGFVIAYLINPIMKFIEKYLTKFLTGRVKSEEKIKKLARTVGTFGALIVLILIIVILIEMMLPQLIKSISGVITNLPTEAQSFVDWINNAFDSNSKVANVVEEATLKGTEYLQSWVKTSFLPDAQSYITSITSGVINVVRVMLNTIIGLIISVYVLLSKEKFIGQAKKLIYAIFKPRRGNIIIQTVRKSNEIFGGFITGKLLDSLIIGILCYIILTIMNMPYSLLVSVIVGVTNIVPFFGPYIGAIPSFIIIVLASPIQGVYFLIFILILQQVDGNIIGPKILGDSTGLSPFWVVFAILVGSGLWGIAGMILGVPVFAVIYYIAQKVIAYFLRRKKLPEDTASYIAVRSVDTITNELRYSVEESEKNKKK